jgi:4-amino-4-deoxy-L-arabinose transferase-like glycosyltransferase
LLLIVATTGLGLLWTTSVPFNEGPDEAAHFHVARFIAEHRRLPVFAPGELWLYRTEVGMVESYSTYPPLAYIIQVGLLLLIDESFWSARGLSLLSYVGAIVLTFLIGRRLVPGNRQVGVSAALVVAVLPQVVFTGAYANTDALALVEVVALLYVLLLIWHRPHPTLFALAGALAGAAFLTKYPTYAAAGVGLVAGTFLASRSRSPHLCRFLFLGVAIASSGWWFARNWQLYGEPIPGQVIVAAKATAGGNSLVVAANDGVNLLTLSVVTDFWPVTLASLVGSFGYATVFLPPGFYAIYAGLAIAGVIGGIAMLASEPLTTARRDTIIVGGSMCLATIGSAMAINVYGEWSAQGRYLFPALVPMVISLVIGWQALAARLALPARTLWVPVGVVAVLNVVTLCGIVVPAYYGPSPQHIIVQVDSPTGDRRLSSDQGDQRAIPIAGWSLLEAASDWQPFAPRSVATYRRPVDQVIVLLGGPPGAGTVVGRAHYGLRRLDVQDYYGRTEGLEQVGFQLVLPQERLGPGKHTVFVCAYAAPEPEPACKSRQLEVL